MIVKRDPLSTNTAPLVIAAALCEYVLREPDNAVSLIRIVDKIIMTYKGDTLPSPIPMVTLQQHFFISLRSGNYTGEHRISVTWRRPSGLANEVMHQTVDFLGGISKVDIFGRLDLLTNEAGTHSFDLYAGKKYLTTVALELLFEAESKQRAGPA